MAGFAIRKVYYGSRVYETAAPVLPSPLHEPAVLVFSKTNGYRHEEAIPAANRALAEIARRRGWSIFFTENGAVFNSRDLARFRATVWNNTTGDVLTPDQKRDFRRYIENGGGFLGLHAAGGDFHYEWDWYADTLLGARFKGHPLGPQFQRATVHVEPNSDGAMRGVPAVWSRVDEWYSFRHSPRQQGIAVLATLDETTYKPKMLWVDLSMGPDHPIIWKHCVSKGRAFYSALGHTAESYREAANLSIIEGGLAWAMGQMGAPCGGSVELER